MSRFDNYPHIPRPTIQPGLNGEDQRHVRNPVPLVAPGEQEYTKMVALALLHLKNEISKLPVMIDDRSKPVDEYNVQSLAAESTSSITVQAQYETPERIDNIIITGPANAAVSLQLGDRVWSLIIATSGILHIGPLGLYLGRSDNRVLTAVTPGEYTLELMGYADTRGNKI
jgi:hypothetical protein